MRYLWRHGCCYICKKQNNYRLSKYIGVEEVKDNNNHYTGKKIVIYTITKKIMAHVSGAKGSSMVKVFGTDINYDKTILLTKSEFFFIDKPAKYYEVVPLLITQWNVMLKLLMKFSSLLKRLVLMKITIKNKIKKSFKVFDKQT